MSNTVDGKGTLRDNLEIVNTYNGFLVVNKENDTILCQRIKFFEYNISFPINWKKYNDAEKWIKEGCIAEIQESLLNLDVGFVKDIIMRNY